MENYLKMTIITPFFLVFFQECWIRKEINLNAVKYKNQENKMLKSTIKLVTPIHNTIHVHSQH